MKKTLLAVIISILIIPTAYSQDSEDSDKDINWERVDYQLMNSLREEYPEASDAELCEILGITYIQQKYWDRGEMYLKIAVDKDPSLYGSWYNLAILYMDTDEGNEYLKKAIEANPDYAPPYYWLAYTYCRHNRDAEAIPVFEQYLKVAKEDDPNEESRIRVATKVLEELRSGVDGKELEMIRVAEGE